MHIDTTPKLFAAILCGGALALLGAGCLDEAANSTSSAGPDARPGAGWELTPAAAVRPDEADDLEVLTLAEATRRLAAAQADPTMAPNCYTVRIHSAANQKYVSAELEYEGRDYGMLRARASQPGPWERFELCPAGNNTFSLRSLANNRYVSAELQYASDYGMLRARATQVGPWERFYSEHGEDYVVYRAFETGALVSAELGYSGGDYGMLRARAGSIGPWEKFD